MHALLTCELLEGLLQECVLWVPRQRYHFSVDHAGGSLAAAGLAFVLGVRFPQFCGFVTHFYALSVVVRHLVEEVDV